MVGYLDADSGRRRHGVPAAGDRPEGNQPGDEAPPEATVADPSR